jgi:hypothetical protein
VWLWDIFEFLIVSGYILFFFEAVDGKRVFLFYLNSKSALVACSRLPCNG